MLTKHQLYLETFMGKHHPDRPGHERSISLSVLRDRDMRIIRKREAMTNDKEWKAWFKWADGLGLNA